MHAKFTKQMKFGNFLHPRILLILLILKFCPNSAPYSYFSVFAGFANDAFTE